MCSDRSYTVLKEYTRLRKRPDSSIWSRSEEVGNNPQILRQCCSGLFRNAVEQQGLCDHVAIAGGEDVGGHAFERQRLEGLLPSFSQGHITRQLSGDWRHAIINITNRL